MTIGGRTDLVKDTDVPVENPGPVTCSVRLVRYKFQTSSGVDREVVLLERRDAERADQVDFLEETFGGPFKRISCVEDPWVNELWLPEVLVVDGSRAL